MKINDKNLCYFATSVTPVDKEGYLMKKGEINKTFQKRWFVLKGNLLFYFEKRNDKDPVGVVILEGCTIELAENVEDAYSFKIMFHGPGNRSYILGADSQESMEQWMKSLACASYDYMKLMVGELQRQLEELDGNNVVDAESPQVPPRRVNPFNKDSTTVSHQQPSSLQHTITYKETPPSVLPTGPTTARKNSGEQTSGGAQVSSKISFRDLHHLYSRPILRDRNEYRHRMKQQELLISL